MTEQEAAMDALEERLATRVAAKLAAMAGGFPSAEDIALIRDHISPTGVAYQNGRRAGRAEALRAVRDALNIRGAAGAFELISKEL